MGDVFQRHLGAADAMDPGQYTTEGCGTTFNAKALVRCPRCGGVDGIGSGHEIQRDGRVIPVWKCPTETCGARLWIWLESFLVDCQRTSGG